MLKILLAILGAMKRNGQMQQNKSTSQPDIAQKQLVLIE
jgi:hypothetical protein